MAEPLDRGEDVVGSLGPAERLWVGVVSVDEGADVAFEGLGRAVDTAADLLIGEHGEEPFDLIDPGCAGRREVSVPARTFGQPVADRLGLVGGIVVHDELDVEIDGHVGLDLVEDLAELAGAMLRVATAEDGAGGDVEGGKQGGRAMPRVVVAAALDLTGQHRQQGLGAVECLDLGLLSSTQSISTRSGGLRYSPTMSRTFSTNSGSVESLKVSLRCGCRLKARQMRWMVEGA